jgi:hypothetical protein
MEADESSECEPLRDGPQRLASLARETAEDGVGQR